MGKDVRTKLPLCFVYFGLKKNRNKGLANLMVGPTIIFLLTLYASYKFTLYVHNRCGSETDIMGLWHKLHRGHSRRCDMER